MMSFIAEFATLQGAPFPNIAAYARRIQSRPAWQRALDRGGPYSFTLPAPPASA